VNVVEFEFMKLLTRVVHSLRIKSGCIISGVSYAVLIGFYPQFSRLVFNIVLSTAGKNMHR
jgi:hypothetical protein